jgi:uncharacterized protein YjiS (DUF1127 family)
MSAGNETSFNFNSLTSDQWERTRQQIIRRAKAARAQALRDLFDAVLRALRRAARGGVAVAEVAVATAGKWWRAFALRRERRAAMRELHALDDRTLRDIGVNRSEIESVVYGRDETRLRDATIADRRCHPRPATAGSGTTASRRQPTRPHLIKKTAA